MKLTFCKYNEINDHLSYTFYLNLKSQIICFYNNKVCICIKIKIMIQRWLNSSLLWEMLTVFKPVTW